MAKATLEAPLKPETAAPKKQDRLVRVKITNKELAEGADWQFNYEGTPYAVINTGECTLPESVVDHLEKLAMPRKAYKEGQESGQSIVVVGTYHRVIVQRLPDIPASEG